MEQAVQVLNLLVEDVGVRACHRLTGVSKSCILAILEVAGTKCARLLDRKIVGVAAEQIQIDEIWSYVHSKQINAKEPEHGDAYTFLAIDRYSKLIVSHYVGKRDERGASAIMRDLRKRVATHCQITTDGFLPYIQATYSHFGTKVDFAQLTKQYGQRQNMAIVSADGQNQPGRVE
jgi:IS1 family transposase